jgi:hypothetical protein
MKGKLNMYYDEDVVFLDINIGEYRNGYFKNLGKGVFERIDEKTKQVTGIAIMGFKERTKNLKDVMLSLPIELELGSVVKEVKSERGIE